MYLYWDSTKRTAVFAGDISAASGTFSGTINATSGKIGSWSISTDGLRYPATGTATVNITPTQLRYGQYFTVGSDGHLTCSSATIGGWYVNGSGFYSGNNYLYNDGIKYGYNQITPSSITLSSGNGTIGGCTVTQGAISVDNNHIQSVEFSKVTSVEIEAAHIKAGAITADKIAAGAITASMIYAGTLQAGRYIQLASNAYIYSGKDTMESPARGFYIGGNGIYIGDGTNYIKYQNGTLTITAPVTVGSLSASNLTSGTFQAGEYIQLASNAYIYSGKSYLDSTASGFYLGQQGFHLGTQNQFIKFSNSTLTIQAQLNVLSGAYIQDGVILGQLNTIAGNLKLGDWRGTGQRGMAYCVGNVYYGGNLTLGYQITALNSGFSGGVQGGTTLNLNTEVQGTNTVNIGISLTTGRLYGTWQSSSSIGTMSDRTLKNSILSIPLQYTTLFDNLRPVIYKYNDGTSDRFHAGFIAQDVEQAILDASLSTQDFAGYIKDQDDVCYLRYEEFIALNTWQTPYLKSRVAELESRLAALEATKI
jgi:hypothetical protein